MEKKILGIINNHTSVDNGRIVIVGGTKSLVADIIEYISEVKPALEDKPKEDCNKCEHIKVCSQNVLFALGGWDVGEKKLSFCSQFGAKK